MARSEITVCSVTLDAENAITLDAGTTLGHYINIASIPCEKLLIGWNMATASTATLVINSGVYSDASIGDLTLSIGSSVAESGCTQIETARYKDADGYITMDVDGTMTNSYMWAVKLA